MRIIFIVIILITLSLIFCGTKKERFTTNEKLYLSEIYNPSYLERNPLVCYVSEAESYLDRRYFEETLRGGISRSSSGFERTFIQTLTGYKNERAFPLVITTDPEMKFKADLALLPEPIVLKMGDEKTKSFPYDYLSHMKDISWSIVQNVNPINPIDSFYNLEDRVIYLKKGGYVEELWNDLKFFFEYKKDPNIVFYDDEQKALEALKNNECDGILTLMTHPNPYIWNMSYALKMLLIPLEVKQKNIDFFSYFMKGLRKTSLSLKEYRYPGLKTKLPSYGYSLSLFVRKDMRSDIVSRITEIVFQPRGIVRSAAVGGSKYIPFHVGTSDWLKEKGFLSIADKNEHPGCTLLAGKSKCEGKVKQIAVKAYETDFWSSQTPVNQSAIPFLKRAYDNQKDEEFGYVYKTAIDDSFMCFEDLKNRDKLSCELNGNTWDRPCLSDKECPFYNANKNYPNEFGKCNSDGFCEMPLGVVRKGYRKYDEDSSPICHGCPPSDPSCCEVRENMASADYAFRNDTDLRVSNKEELKLRDIDV